MIKIIVAISENNVIGSDNKLIWSLPNDLKRFKRLTEGSSVIMGRKTYESIGKPLPNRENIIISRNLNYKVDNCKIFNRLDSALKYCDNNCYIIGGGEIYKQSIIIADKINLTVVHENFTGDTYFPDFLNKGWKEVYRERNRIDNNHKYEYSFIDYEKIR